MVDQIEDEVIVHIVHTVEKRMLAWFLWENIKIKAHLENMVVDGG
jgi:hypothetical protein